VSVAVLNGTKQAGLAATVAAKLKADQFATGTVADAPNQNLATTTVDYTPGHQSAALEVAQELALGVSSAFPVSTADLSAASAGSSTPPDVVVVLGADYHA
jgi:hypothetical protein